MTFDVTVQRGRDHFALHHAPHFSHFFGTLIDQQYHQVDFRMVNTHGICDVLQQHRFAGPWGSHQEGSLTFADRTQQIHDAHGHRTRSDFQFNLLKRVDRRQCVEVLDVNVLIRSEAIDQFDFAQTRPLIASALSYVTADQHTFPESILFDK